jgi:hypothetical protein
VIELFIEAIISTVIRSAFCTRHTGVSAGSPVRSVGRDGVIREKAAGPRMSGAMYLGRFFCVRLEFLRVLLGNEPALEPHEHLYHQFQASEANVAAKEADSWVTDRNFGSYLDEVAVPALRAASDDQKRGVLSREQVAELNATLQEFIELIKESLEYKHEQLSATDTHDSRSGRSEVSALILAGRGTLDATAAQLIAEVISLILASSSGAHR